MNTSRTPLFYMANLGSEISRALLEYQGKEFQKMSRSIDRAKNIIKKVEAFPEMKNRTGELEIITLIIESLSQKNLQVDKDQLIGYFTPFAMRLMSNNHD